jgi:hypothetical protein
LTSRITPKPSEADLKAVNNHGLLNLEMNEEMYGRLLMGLEPNTPLI